MVNIVEVYKQKMQTAPVNGLPDNELDIIEELLENPPNEVDTILEWIFTEHKGYIEPRARAGLKFLEKNPTQGWLILERLINSSDPDNRDTALTVLGKVSNTDKYYLAKPLLKDPYPYLQFDAVELLLGIYPEEAKSVLWQLANHETEAWVRENSRKLLLEMNEDIEAGYKTKQSST
jgi:hypothetical protein